MFENLNEIISKGDNGDIDAMIVFVKDWELKKASKEEPDILSRRISYLVKLVEANIPFAFQELAFFYEDSNDYFVDISLCSCRILFNKSYEKWISYSTTRKLP